MAHIFVRQIYGRAPQSHGYEWKRMMATLGLKADRCHNMEVPEGVKVGKPKMKYNYQCSVCKENLVVGPKHHAGLQKGRSLFHSSCGKHSKLVYVGDIGRMNYGEAKAAANDKLPQPVKATPAPTVHVPRSGSKMDICKQLVAANPNASRQDMLAMFINIAGCATAGASTYYSTLVKK